ncbi:hypothetical protein EZV62_010294 [Acer yangbiense]|uniref:Uncharacterized protein n=1 Tax=Acer yangbiense TaxID=1000413 RepID=A0A5C7I2B6_9ROSI|nr:hypothetical protein EZV62_010294 [Acer yangbiense]
MDVRLLINYMGQWDELQYVGGETFVELVSKELTYLELTYLELENLVFEFINVDRTLYALRISSVVSTDNGRRKYHICRDRDVGFLLHTGTHCLRRQQSHIVRRETISLSHTRFTKTNFKSFCHDYYSISWLQTTYAPPINPVPHVSI